MPMAFPSKLPVLDSVKEVVTNSRQVKFHSHQLSPAVSRWGHLLETSGSWEHPCHFFDGTAETVRWIFVLDVLNHCFWPDEGNPVWTVSFQGRDWSGYWGLAAALKRAVERDYPLTDPGYLATMPSADLREIFAGNGEIPMLGERLANLHEAGQVLQERLNGDIVHLVEQARGSAVQLVLQVVAAFPSFRDEACYHGKPVTFWKRAQILAADLFHAFSGKDWGAFDDIHQLTAFADYKLPQVLRHLGIIAYAPDLERRIDRRELLPPGSEQEVEIRAATIHAVEGLCQVFRQSQVQATAMAVDQWLWHLGQMEVFRTRPYHLCRTIFY